MEQIEKKSFFLPLDNCNVSLMAKTVEKHLLEKECHDEHDMVRFIKPYRKELRNEATVVRPTW